jgi:hypothetical protein
LMKKNPRQMNRMTTATLMITITKLVRADS